MKNLFIISVTLICLMLLSMTAVAQEKSPAKSGVKIGIFDSRVVALAYFRSAERMAQFKEMHKELQQAKTENNEKRVKELEKEGPWTQIRMHQQVFSNAGVSNIMKKISNELPAIAKEAGVLLIVSKWDMPYIDQIAETVDVTLPIAKLFKPDEQTMKIIGQMKDQTPVPFDELPLDPMM
ncbi:hypothetical protein JW964_25485 [candidate division KSB1 bacterium]|nr:hypothetical protein [candidate division KSB1 bacterium]